MFWFFSLASMAALLQRKPTLAASTKTLLFLSAGGLTMELIYLCSLMRAIRAASLLLTFIWSKSRLTPSLAILYITSVHKRGTVMLTKSIKEARSTFSALIDRVQSGETISITRHGKQAAYIVPSKTAGTKLPSLKQFRARIKSAQSPLSDTVVRSRDEARF